jgi:polyisoprenyl-phosphate glycosyltransferase
MTFLEKSLMEKKKILSVVVPVFSEEMVLEEFYRLLKDVLTSLEDTLDHEIIFVNDGSADRSLDVLLSLQRQDSRIRVVNLSRNFGHQIAITAGIDHSRGDAVVIMDCDLQDPPETLPALVKKWNEGFNVVYGVRNARRGENFFKRFTAHAYYRLLNRLSDIDIPLDAGDFRLMDRTTVDALRSMKERSRYIRGMVSWIGFRQCSITYDRGSRHLGITKFSLNKMMKFAFDGITSFSEAPLNMASYLGIVVTCFCFLYLCWIIVDKLMDPGGSVKGWSSTLAVILFLGGIQLISLGIIGQYLGRIYQEIKGRPLYIIEKKCGFEDAESPVTPDDKSPGQHHGDG